MASVTPSISKNRHKFKWMHCSSAGILCYGLRKITERLHLHIVSRDTICERYGLRHALPGIWPKEAGPIDAMYCNLTPPGLVPKDRVRAAAENRRCYCTWCFCAQSQSASQLSLLRLFSILLFELSTFTADTLWRIREWNTVPGASLLKWFPRACIDIHFISWLLTVSAAVMSSLQTEPLLSYR